MRNSTCIHVRQLSRSPPASDRRSVENDLCWESIKLTWFRVNIVLEMTEVSRFSACFVQYYMINTLNFDFEHINNVVITKWMDSMRHSISHFTFSTPAQCVLLALPELRDRVRLRIISLPIIQSKTNIQKKWDRNTYAGENDRSVPFVFWSIQKCSCNGLCGEDKEAFYDRCVANGESKYLISRQFGVYRMSESINAHPKSDILSTKAPVVGPSVEKTANNQVKQWFWRYIVKYETYILQRKNHKIW